MRAFLVWLVIACTGFGGLAGGYHVYLDQNPRRIAVVLDTSFPMQSVWSRVPGLLDRLGGRPYTEYALLTDKSRVHGWSGRLSAPGMTPYAPRDFGKLATPGQYPELEEATEVVFVTNADDASTAAFGGWRVVRPGT